MTIRLLTGAALAAAISLTLFTRAVAARPDIDAVFARYTTATPGCAVAVSTDGTSTPALAKGYGMADLEHDVRITPDTIFEAGSVSKQFTAAAVLLLARDGKLSIDDPVRRYIPELPDYGKPLLIRHMLNHTSGLRDWGSVAAISGWPRTSRVHTHAHVLEIASRQQALNFPPGSRWSYSNTGFNLAAIIVSRVSGVPFVDFTRDRIFRPLGMTHTSWRNDFTRIVKGRAIAYDDEDGEFHTDMPFENVYGNGGLLTTVGDLLKWNENFSRPVVGDADFVALQQQPGAFNDGRRHNYAFGLYVGKRQGEREVYHSGSTAGYSAFLTRFPDRKLGIAVLCNVATNATTLAHAVADQYLGITAPVPPLAVTEAEIHANAGLYRNTMTGAALRIDHDREAALRGRRWSFDGHGGAAAVDDYGTTETFERVEAAAPTAQALEAYAGLYASDEAEVELRAIVENGRLVLKRRPDTTMALTPLYADAFSTPGLGTVIFHRNADHQPVEFHVSQERVWNMTFARERER